MIGDAERRLSGEPREKAKRGTFCNPKLGAMPSASLVAASEKTMTLNAGNKGALNSLKYGAYKTQNGAQTASALKPGEVEHGLDRKQPKPVALLSLGGRNFPTSSTLALRFASQKLKNSRSHMTISHGWKFYSSEPGIHTSLRWGLQAAAGPPRP